jgi:hypothetical protein
LRRYLIIFVIELPKFWNMTMDSNEDGEEKYQVYITIDMRIVRLVN